MAVTEALVEDLMGTIMVAIPTAATTTPVAIPMGMTTYGLDIVVKFSALRFFARPDKAAAHL